MTSEDPTAPGEGKQGASEGAERARYGVSVVYVGLLVVLAAFALAVLHYSAASDVSTALAPVTGVVGTIVGAYFGVQVGGSGKDKAEDARTKADEEVKKLAAIAPGDDAVRALGLNL